MKEQWHQMGNWQSNLMKQPIGIHWQQSKALRQLGGIKPYFIILTIVDKNFTF